LDSSVTAAAMLPPALSPTTAKREPSKVDPFSQRTRLFDRNGNPHGNRHRTRLLHSRKREERLLADEVIE
jgi:hypothetical protein